MLQHAVLVDAGLVREGVGADDRLVGRPRRCRRWPPAPAGRHQPRRHDAGVVGQRIARTCSAITNSSSEALPARSPMPLMVHSTWRAPAWTAASELATAMPEVVVAVRRQRDLVADARRDRGEHPGDVGRQRVADRVGQVDGRGAGLDRGVRHLAEELQVAPGGVLGRELHVRACAARACATASRICARQLARSMRSLCSRWRSEVARNTWMRGRAAPASAAQARSMSPVTARARPGHDRPSAPPRRRPHRLEIPVGRDREAGFDDVRRPAAPAAAAMRSFSAGVMLKPGACSPSRSVVSKTWTRARGVIGFSAPFQSGRADPISQSNNRYGE